jgi:hypothetical protein
MSNRLFQNLDDRADLLQQLDMFSIANSVCEEFHRGTDGDGVVTDEKLCVVAGNNRGMCGGEYEE